MIDEHVNNNRKHHTSHFDTDGVFLIIFVLNLAEQLKAFHHIVLQLLSDVQERLVYRAHIYVQNDILGYKPVSGDLAYPEKLEMMEVSILRVLAVFFYFVK